MSTNQTYYESLYLHSSSSTTFQVVSIGLLILITIMLIVFTFGYFGGLLSYQYKTDRWWFSTQYAAMWCGFIFAITGVIGIMTKSANVCNLASRIAAVAYGATSLSLYLFLFLRSRILKFGRSFTFIVLEKLLLLFMVCYALIAPPLLFLRSQSIIVSFVNADGEACAFYTDLLVSNVILIFDSVLSLGFLFLFAYPVFVIGCDKQGDKTLRDKLIENLIVSGIMISTTSVTMMLFSSAGTPDDYAWASSLSYIDTLINIFCSCFISRGGWSRREKSLKGPTSSRSNEQVNPPNHGGGRLGKVIAVK